MADIYLTRKNLLTLLSKLDRKKAGEETQCTIIKNDTLHSEYPCMYSNVSIKALEDEEYYTDRDAGVMHPDDS